jgi:acetolactate synthase-1/2/3 large subunit
MSGQDGRRGDHAAALKAEGIEHIFGIVGTHDCPLFDGVFEDPAFQVVTVWHEQAASLMAAGYARASGKIAACRSGPRHD